MLAVSEGEGPGDPRGGKTMAGSEDWEKTEAREEGQGPRSEGTQGKGPQDIEDAAAKSGLRSDRRDSSPVPQEDPPQPLCEESFGLHHSDPRERVRSRSRSPSGAGGRWHRGGSGGSESREKWQCPGTCRPIYSGDTSGPETGPRRPRAARGSHPTLEQRAPGR